jgi:protein-tyrosine-phosphatase
VAGIPEVLFVCTHNAGRSQVAAALLDQEASAAADAMSLAGRIRLSVRGWDQARVIVAAGGSWRRLWR